jgi:protoporphyrinogen/coproporphyrinogen III oxidase
MNRIAIVGGGIAGLAAAYELEKARRAGADIDWHLYEATDRLGGIVSTTRIDTPEGRFVLEDGPDGWVTEKPWAYDLAIELGLTDQIIPCNEDRRRTLILIDGKLQPMPQRMRMMIPEDLTTLEGSTLFSDAARAAYAAELADATALKAAAPTHDESVASFVLRHFGEEVLNKIGAPLLSGVLGGDVHKLSVRAVMPAFVAMEHEHGSLIAALQAKAKERGPRPPRPTFTTLRNGMGTLAEAIIAKLPADRIHLHRSALSLKRERNAWCLRTSTEVKNGKSKRHFNHIFLATPADVTRRLLEPLSPNSATLIPSDASSAVLVAMAFPAAQTASITIPEGFGFLVPQTSNEAGASVPNATEAAGGFRPLHSDREKGALAPEKRNTLLAATFVDQKYPDRVPPGARILRAFFSGPTADALSTQPDATIAAAAHEQLSQILGPLPTLNLALTTVRRWPRSLPQYEVNHLDRMAQLDDLIITLGGLTLLGNAYRGVGVPDLIRDSQVAVRNLLS